MAEGEENEAEELRFLQQLYEENYKELSEIISNSISTSNMMSANIEVLSKIDEIKSNTLLLNLGAGTYVEVKMAGNGKIMTYVGAGYIVEKSAEDAKNFLEENRSKTLDFIKKIDDERKQVEDALLEISYRLGAMDAKGN
ncbi:MAG: prefoldin subunit alpha [Candidatus Micrarchaeaceae archaeon]